MGKKQKKGYKTKKSCFDTTFMFSLGTYKTDICVSKQLSVYTLECVV